MKKILSCAIVAVLLTVSSVSAGDSFFKGSKLANIGYQVPAEVGRFVTDDFATDDVYFQKVPPAPGSQKKALEAAPKAKGHAHPHHGHAHYRTRYKDLRNIHPCAVKKVVSIIDPCFDPRSCCKPKCVKVTICVPPCGCAKVRVSRSGRRVKYDYGKYEIKITSRNGKITVDYDD